MFLEATLYFTPFVYALNVIVIIYFSLTTMKFHAITIICILLFIGAAEKSAQIGLHTWLSDEISCHNCYLYFNLHW
jgi:NADH:ubiquinone oxidoreductase subunit 5 (subunit L)/multisubunit Na+/H+ antiporter MnhA subunit